MFTGEELIAKIKLIRRIVEALPVLNMCEVKGKDFESVSIELPIMLGQMDKTLCVVDDMLTEFIDDIETEMAADKEKKEATDKWYEEFKKEEAAKKSLATVADGPGGDDNDNGQ